MTDRHLTSDTLARLRARRLDPAASVAAFRHIASCAACAARSLPDREHLENIHNAVMTPDLDHLDAATQLIPYVDGTLDAAGREIVESHIDDCAMCREELEDLRTPSVIPSEVEGPGRAEGARHTPRSLTGLALAAAIVAIAIALAVLVARTRSVAPETPMPPREIRVVPPPPLERERTRENALPPRYADPRWEGLVADAVTRGRLPFPPDLDELDPPPGEIRGGDADPKQRLSPAGVVIAETRPDFRWPAEKNATSTVFVYEGETEVMNSGRVERSRWRPARTLRSGRTYTWQVEIEANGSQRVLPAPPTPPAMFRILTDQQRQEIAAALAQHPNDFLLHAVLHARHGQRREAEAALARAIANGDAKASQIESEKR